jgi:hypothetical protein
MTTLTCEQRAQRTALIDEVYRLNPAAGYLAAVQEGAQRFRQGGRAGRPAAPVIPPGVLAEAIATALVRQKAARKARKAAAEKTRERATAEAAAAQVLQERQQLAAQFSETAIAKSLQEASNADLAFITTTALSGTGQPSAEPRPVMVMTVRPETLSLEDLGVAATAGSAGKSAFWAGQTSGDSPFWRGLQGTGAGNGTADA